MRRRGSVMSESAVFRYRLRVRYSECDAQKVVFNSRYGEYVDVAALEFTRALGWLEALSGPLDYQLVKQTTQWFAPARHDQVLELSVQALQLGNTSFTLLTEFRILGHEPVICRVETVYVLLDAASMQKTPLPEALRAALNAGTPALVDHGSGPGSPR